MAFNPSSTIYLCGVPIDNTYTNQIYFANETEQREYFLGRVRKTFTEYLTVRKTLADGSNISSVKVNANIDSLYNCNYMFYQNANHGAKWFYAFINKLVYINEGTTEIVFETDVYQTWCFDVRLQQSYVVREHSITDEIGDNIVPEKFSFQDYTYKKLKDDDTLNEWRYLVGCSEKNFDESWWEATFGDLKVEGQKMSGVYQGTYFFTFGSIFDLNNFLEKALEAQDDCILFISVIPYFNISRGKVGTTETQINEKQGYIYGTDAPANKEIDMSFSPLSYDFGAYTPKNKKLYTAPFYKLVVTNHNGEQAEYNIEEFSDPASIKFKMYGDISANPSVTLLPMNYKGIDENYESGISITGFPQCSFNTDTYKLWLAKNQFSTGLRAVTSVAEIAGGAVALATGAGAIAGAGAIVHGASGVINTFSSTYQASREPNKVNGGGGKNNLLTAMGKNKFEYYIQTIKEDYAVTVDGFFTMYGYQTNAVKYPNISARPHFNYIQTVDCNITGTIPDDDMRALKAIFNNGCTFWKKDSTVGNYDVDNSPVKPTKEG